MTQRINSAPYAVVVGGVNVDIGGKSYAPLVARDSNPGRVYVSLGGVGRNIAHSMALLGVDTRFLTVLGDDLYAEDITASCGELGIDISQALRVPGGQTSIYLFIHGDDGNMALAVADMDIYNHLTPRFLESRLELLQNARVVVADANIPAETLAWLAEHVDAPIFADPVSTAKAGRLGPILGKLHTLKPNRMEAELLSGVKITDEVSLCRAAGKLLDTGLQRIFLSLGSHGLYAADRSGAVRLPCFPAAVSSATGAGDAFMAALVWAWLEGADLDHTAKAAQAAAAITIESEETVNPALSVAAVKTRAGI